MNMEDAVLRSFNTFWYLLLMLRLVSIPTSLAVVLVRRRNDISTGNDLQQDLPEQMFQVAREAS